VRNQTIQKTPKNTQNNPPLKLGEGAYHHHDEGARTQIKGRFLALIRRVITWLPVSLYASFFFPLFPSWSEVSF
tara:strand:- start:202 stop:423 length:222 start_codon:yes stop_codon:yes gene_type:complete